jgi:hypothetical protein
MSEKGLEIPINRTRPLAARTDAENGYLQRHDNKGRLLIEGNIDDKFGIRTHLHDGNLVLFFAPIRDAVQIGDSFSLKIGMQDDSMPQPIRTDGFLIRVVDKEKPQPKPDPDPKPKPKSGDQGNTKGTGKTAPTHGLPPYKLLTKEGGKFGKHDTEAWPEGFSENDGGLIEDLGEQGLLYKINIDNTYHLKYRVQQRGGGGWLLASTHSGMRVRSKLPGLPWRPIDDRKRTAPAQVLP